jgi:hypothetical protein
LLYSLQGQRPEPGALSFTNADVGADIEKWLTANEGIPIDESIGKALSPEAEQAIRTGDYGSPKVMQEIDQLARSMAQAAVTPGFAKGFWTEINKNIGIGSRGLVVYRAAQLLSSGATMWGNAINNVIRLVQLPVSQALGAGLQLDFNRAGQSMMIYGQYVKNLSEAYRLGTESFKAGMTPPSISWTRQCGKTLSPKLSKQQCLSKELSGNIKAVANGPLTLPLGLIYKINQCGQWHRKECGKL